MLPKNDHIDDSKKNLSRRFKILISLISILLIYKILQNVGVI
jgi:hypothetical protein